MSTLRSADIASGVICAALGCLMIVESLNIENPLDEPLHPNTLPMALSAIMLILGLVLAFRAWRFTGTDSGVAWPEWSGWLNIIVTGGALALFFLLMPVLGLPVTAFLFITGLAGYLDRQWFRAATTGLCVSLILYFAFIRFLDMPFPLGILERF